MKILIPAWHAPYLDLVIKAGLYEDGQLAVAAVFGWGLGEAEDDAEMAGEPDMDLGLLRGRQLKLSVPMGAQDRARLRAVARSYRMPVSRAATVVFLQGLFDHYLHLKSSASYRRDPAFRRAVDGMPHDFCYDEP